jgi:hypothetical protein
VMGGYPRWIKRDTTCESVLHLQELDRLAKSLGLVGPGPTPPAPPGSGLGPGSGGGDPLRSLDQDRRGKGLHVSACNLLARHRVPPDSFSESGGAALKGFHPVH